MPKGHGMGRYRLQDGATAVEYGIMVALIAVVIVGAVYLIGLELRDGYECVSNARNALPGTDPCVP
jgi:pilus assembly protein Flp/PilA